ncbi:MAG TPA: ABC transporter permease, partial [Myxococcales bacterium]
MDGLLRDLRFAVRGLLRTPGFTAAAVLALALGIGATTAIFSVVHAVLMRSLGWGEETRLVSIATEFKGLGLHASALSVPEVMDLSRAPFLESYGAYTDGTGALQGERTERVGIGYATSGFFRALGVSALYGRTFAPEEDFKGRDGVAVVSAAAWRRRYGSDPAVVGRTITLQGRPCVVVGILPEGFSYDGAHDFFIPFGFTEAQLTQQRGAHYVEAVGRLRPGVSLEAAEKGIAELGARVNAEHPESYASDRGFGFTLRPLRDRFVGSSRQPLLILFGAVLMVLLIACANVANLLLARSASREHEFAVRAAIGAGRARIVRQLLTEGLLLSCMGMAIGLLVSAWGLDALLAAAPSRIRELTDVRVDRAVLGFSMLLTVATTLVFALVPALRASRVDVAFALKDGARGTTGVPAARLRSALVAAQMAVSLCLLAAAGLMLRSFAEVLRVSPGFDPEGVTAVMLYPGGPAYDQSDEARARYFGDALRAASAIPGVQAAGGIDELPTRGTYRLSYFIEGYERRPGETQPSDAIRRAWPGYFAAIGERVLAGREFTAADDAKAPPVALVNEAWVRRYFPGQDVIGRRIRLDSKTDGEWRTIVGVVADARERGLDQPAPPVYYFAAAQAPPDQMALVVRGSAAAATLREVVARVDPTQPVDRAFPLAEVLSASLSQRRFPLELLGAFAALALLLSALGVGGATSYAVAQRTREIGLRMAIGASPAGVVTMVLGATLRVVGIGLAAGAALSLGSARLLASQLYGVGARDPLT